MTDSSPYWVLSEIRGFLGSIKDEGTEIDSGFGMGAGDLWVTIGGVEYILTLKKSNAQTAKEGQP